ncbi:MAG: hypothetical protein U5N86_09105 [Planctomycetota bacterium]|nr:hypothetical protein [Planctomycetota bacterium]
MPVHSISTTAENYVRLDTVPEEYVTKLSRIMHLELTPVLLVHFVVETSLLVIALYHSHALKAFGHKGTDVRDAFSDLQK